MTITAVSLKTKSTINKTKIHKRCPNIAQVDHGSGPPYRSIS